MSVSHKIGVLITKYLFSYVSFNLPDFFIYTNFRSWTKPMQAFFKKNNFIQILKIWQKQGFLYFPLKIIFAHREQSELTFLGNMHLQLRHARLKLAPLRKPYSISLCTDFIFHCPLGLHAMYQPRHTDEGMCGHARLSILGRDRYLLCARMGRYISYSICI